MDKLDIKDIKVKVIDDEKRMAEAICKNLKQLGYQVSFVMPDEYKVKDLIAEDIQVVLLDMKLGTINGLDLLKEIKNEAPIIEVIIITGFASVDNAISATKEGAFDYFEKPIEWSKLKLAINNAARVSKLIRENEELRRVNTGDTIISTSNQMKQVKYLIDRVKDTDTTILITGESGTGKELVARKLHSESSRSSQDMVSINCAALPENLLESELFGFKKGAFTGADRDHIGKFVQASGSTIFLDEIGDMPLSLQGKLLRVLQEKIITPIGSKKPEKIDCRVIAATNQKLKDMIKRGSFREDLYYRIAVFEINIPPLRERKEDLPGLIDYFFAYFNQKHNRQVEGFTTQAYKLFEDYSLPGNVRQLKNIVERAVLLTKGQRAGIEDLPAEVKSSSTHHSDLRDIALKEYLSFKEEEFIIKWLEKLDYNKKKTAKKLGISRQSLYNKLDKYGL